MTNVHLTGLARDLAAHADTGKPIRIGVIGSGEMGTDLVTQCMLMPGMELAAISTRRPHTALAAHDIAYGHRDKARETDTRSRMSEAIDLGLTAVTSDPELMVTAPEIDVVIDATGKPGVAADYDLMAMEHGKHIVMMNVEADVTIGPYLKHEADRLGVIYTVGAGDEPSSAMELIEFASALGYTIVSAGKGKNNPLNHDAVPDDYREEAERRNMNPRMLVEFVDGSKTAVEMAAIAKRHRPCPRRARHARPQGQPRGTPPRPHPERGWRRPQQDRRRRLHHRQGRRAGRFRRRQGRAPPHHRAQWTTSMSAPAPITAFSAPTT